MPISDSYSFSDFKITMPRHATGVSHNREAFICLFSRDHNIGLVHDGRRKLRKLDDFAACCDYGEEICKTI